MGGIVFVLILAAISAILAWATKNLKIGVRDVRESTGMVEKVIYTDTGNAYYYVSFKANGELLTGQSITYASSTKTLNNGDEVRINYYFTKSGRVRVIILDNTLAPCEAFLPAASKIFGIVSIVLFAIAVIQIITKFL